MESSSIDSTLVFAVSSATAAADRSAAKPVKTLRNEVTLVAPTALAIEAAVENEAVDFKRTMKRPPATADVSTAEVSSTSRMTLLSSIEATSESLRSRATSEESRVATNPSAAEVKISVIALPSCISLRNLLLKLLAESKVTMYSPAGAAAVTT